jgi:hypothetical protein
MDTGDTILIPEPGTSLDSHLWIVLSDPIADSERIVLVNFTKHRPDKDQACVLQQGDHPFIRQLTCVNYRQAKIVSEDQLERLVHCSHVEKREALSPDVLERILGGVADSRMPLDVAQILADQGLVQI